MFQPFEQSKVSAHRRPLAQNWGSSVVAIGYSARSRVAAIVDCDMHAHAVDHFGDFDTQNLAKSNAVIIDWGGDPEVAAKLVKSQVAGLPPGTPVLTGGGVDTWPAFHELLQEAGTVVGPTTSQVSHLREPTLLRQVAEEAGCYFPKTGADLIERKANTAGSEQPIPVISKPLIGAGGIGIRRADVSPANGYLQEFIAGRSLGVYCLITLEGVELLGATESFSKDQWAGPSEFIYRGSWGPIQLSSQEYETAIKAAHAIGRHQRWAGFLQLDFIQSEDGRLWLLEVNPRWTAGMEVLLQCGCNPLRRLRNVLHSPKPLDSPVVTTSSSCFARAVVYAPFTLSLEPELLQRLHCLPTDEFSDIPNASLVHQVVESGQPLLSLGTRVDLDAGASLGETRCNVLRELSRKSDELLSWLFRYCC